MIDHIGVPVRDYEAAKAFEAKTRAEVDAFHAAALQAGATDNGAPAPRTHYRPDDYGAFVRDPDGINLEAVCHRPG